MNRSRVVGLAVVVVVLGGVAYVALRRDLPGDRETLRRIAELQGRLATVADETDRLRTLEALGALQLDAGLFSAAEETSRRRLAEAVEVVDRHLAARALADLWVARETLDEEAAALSRRLDGSPGDAEALLLLGEIFHDIRPDPTRWIPLHERFLSVRPDDHVCLQRLAGAYREKGDAGALFRLYRDLSRSAKDERQRTAARDGLIRLWREFGKLEEALAGLEAVRRERPADPEALLFLGEIYWGDLDRYKEAALPVYEGLARLRPDDGRVQERLVEVYFRNGRYADEIRLARTLADRFPETRFDRYMNCLAASAKEGDRAGFYGWLDRLVGEFGSDPWTFAKAADVANGYADAAGGPDLSERIVALCDAALAGPAKPAASAGYISHVVGTIYIEKARACARLGRAAEARELIGEVERDGISKHLRETAATVRKNLFPGGEAKDPPRNK